jgi:hypothetical protein
LGSIGNSPEAALHISANTLCAFGSKKCDSDFRKSVDFEVFSAFVTECSKKIANLSLNGILAFRGSDLASVRETITE